jgi:negative regulator of flagellin synthesis FlgM
MKIRDRLSTHTVGSTRGVAPREKASEAAPAGRTAGPADSVQISARSVEIQKARQLAIQAPDIRQELVGPIASQIESGEYNVTGAEVAPKLIRELLMDVR